MGNSHFLVGASFYVMNTINGIIYKYTNKINGLVYIGKTTRESQRRYEHNRHKDMSIPFSRAVLKYGYDNFDYEVIFRVTGWDKQLVNDVLNYWEVYYIKECNSAVKGKGYNISYGGDGYCVWNDDSRKKNSDSHKGNLNGMYGTKAPNRKRVRCEETGIEYDSYKDASKELGVTSVQFYNYMSKQRRTTNHKTYHGYHWTEI